MSAVGYVLQLTGHQQLPVPAIEFSFRGIGFRYEGLRTEICSKSLNTNFSKSFGRHLDALVLSVGTIIILSEWPALRAYSEWFTNHQCIL